jgi:hypothetical protein
MMESEPRAPLPTGPETPIVQVRLPDWSLLCGRVLKACDETVVIDFDSAGDSIPEGSKLVTLTLTSGAGAQLMARGHLTHLSSSSDSSCEGEFRFAHPGSALLAAIASRVAGQDSTASSRANERQAYRVGVQACHIPVAIHPCSGKSSLELDASCPSAQSEGVVAGVVLDLSAEGMGLLVEDLEERRFELGEEVQLLLSLTEDFEQLRLRGTVHQCRSVRGGVRYGIHIEPEHTTEGAHMQEVVLAFVMRRQRERVQPQKGQD